MTTTINRDWDSETRPRCKTLLISDICSDCLGMGKIDPSDHDPINYNPQSYKDCDTCLGEGEVTWYPKCKWQLEP